MVSLKSQSIRIPGEEERELWLSDGAGVWKRAEAPEARGPSGGLWAIECLSLDSAPFWSLSPKGADVSLEETAGLHWAALGLEEDAHGRLWACWHLDDEQGQTLAGTAALTAMPGESAAGAGEDWQACMPEAFEVSARLFEIPSSEVAVWKELGRYVVAFQRGEGVVHFSVLQSRELNADAAWEIRDLALSLEVRGFIHAVHGCRVWTHAGDAFTSTLKEALGVRVRLEAKPAPQLPKVESNLLPPEMGRLREARAKRKRLAGWVAMACLVYVLFFGGWTGLLFLREYKLDRNNARQARLAPEVESVREAQNRWYALEAATNRDLYPGEMYHQVLSMIPPDGIRLTEFSMDEQKMVLVGEARSVALAMRFASDVKTNQALSRYTWIFPQESAGEDGRTPFRGEGHLNGGNLP